MCKKNIFEKGPELDSSIERSYTIHMYSMLQSDSSRLKVESIESDKALERSRRVCMQDMAVVNPAVGCMFQCLFCGSHRRDLPAGTVRLRANLPELLERELLIRRRKDNLPKAVFFNTTSDSFQPIDSLLRLTYECMRIVLENGLDLYFFTRGLVPESFADLFQEHHDQVHAQVSMFTMDDKLSAVYEPGAAPPRERLESARRLSSWEVDVRGRFNPLLPFLSDTVAHIEELLSYLRSAGISRTSASYVVLRPNLLDLLERTLPDTHFHLIKGSFKGQTWRKEGINQMTKLLPERTRRKGYERLVNIGKRMSMEIDICACGDQPLGSGCLAPLALQVVDRPAAGQMNLFS